jgi:ABC-type dipeptide/oligopeptide/nickel transport system ATPase component
MIVAEDERLESLPGAKLSGVQWDPDKVCLPGTRSNLLEKIISWMHSPESERILWLSGAAGTGKSSVANSVAEYFHRLGRLGASFRFDRHDARPETPGLLFGNICHQLALSDDQLRVAVLSAIRHGSSGAMSLRMQARTLLVETTKRAEIVGPVVIVIDALDESGPDGGHEPNREKLVQAIVEELPALPPSIKVLITSRDEGKISLLMPGCSSCLSMRMEDVPHTEEDILRYIQHRMLRIRRTLPSPLDDWPGATRETELAHCADGLFIWASVACAVLESDGDDPDIQLVKLIRTSRAGVKAEETLDLLYLDVLRRSRPKDEGIPANNWDYVVGSLVTLKTPLAYRDMDSLLSLSAKMQQRAMTLIDGRQIQLTTCHRILSSLRPILKIDANMKDVIRLLHKSVFDYLTQRASNPIGVDLSLSNAILAKQCLDQMNRSLRYDICGIGDPSLLISRVDGFSERVDANIPAALRYACRYFADHLNDILEPLPALRAELERFITKNLLHWIEVMGILNQIAEAEGCLHSLSDYMKVNAWTDVFAPHADLSFRMTRTLQPRPSKLSMMQCLF